MLAVKANSGVIIEKPWGGERIWALTDRYVGKVITINSGHKLSLQYHKEKEETILVMIGSLRLHYGETEGTLETKVMTYPDAHHIAPGLIHRFEALTDCVVIEVSTPELDDVVRLQDDYGREGT